MQDSSKLSEAVECRLSHAWYLCGAQVSPVQTGERWIRSQEEGGPLQRLAKCLEWNSAAELTKLDTIGEAID